MSSILFISKSSEAPSTRYRALQYLPLLQAAGWEAEHRAWTGDVAQRRAVLEQAGRVDVVVSVRRTFGPLTRRLLRRAARRLVFDFDDAIFLDTAGRTRGSRWRRFASMLRRCDDVWAGNDFLAEHARRFNPSVCVLPTSIDADKYLCDAAPDADHVDLVWVGSSSTRRYLEAALPMLESVAEQMPQLRLKVIADFELRGGLPILNIPWSAEGEMQAIASSAIGIAPMPDDPWTRGKCGCKVLQYMAAGLPVVVSDMSTHRRCVDAGVEGYLAADTEQWIAAIRHLVYDPQLRRRCGQAGRERLVREFCLTGAWSRMSERLEKLIDPAPQRPRHS